VNDIRRLPRWVIVFALVYPSLATLVYFILLADYSASVQQTTFGVVKTIQFLWPIAWVWSIERPRLIRPTASGMGFGVAFGLAVFAAMLALYFLLLKPSGLLDAAADEVRKKVAGFGVDSLEKYVLMAALYATSHAFLEEYYWRWFVFGQLRLPSSVGSAIVISSVGFMAHHVLVLGFYFGWLSPATLLFSLAVAVGGAVWAWLYHTSRSLYAPWLSHMIVDAAIFAVGYDMVHRTLG
jgi:membrane protease YdiL (CAAX protease family)